MRIMIISDVTTYQGIPEIVDVTKPDYIIIAGDILYDGKGHRYIDKNGRIISGNTHENEKLLGLHMKWFREFLDNSLDRGVKQILLIYGDHDSSENVDFNQLISSWNLDAGRIIDISYPTIHDLDNVSLFLIPYIDEYDELREILRESRYELETADIIVTHLELSKLRILAWSLQANRSNPILLVAGHYGIGYYPPGQAWRDLVLDPMRIHELAITQLPPGKVDTRQLQALIEKIKTEELEKHKWLIEDTIIHLARIDNSPYSFLVLEKHDTTITGKLYFLAREQWNGYGERFFCKIRDPSVELPILLRKIFRHYIMTYRVCEFSISL